MKNALNPVVTAVSGWFASLLAGAVFVGFIFNWNGLGKEIVDALNTLDQPVLMGAVLLVASLFVLINICVDVLYGWLDPKIGNS
jgi:peptide/nickel transport system permease protein